MMELTLDTNETEQPNGRDPRSPKVSKGGHSSSCSPRTMDTEHLQSRRG